MKMSRPIAGAIVVSIAAVFTASTQTMQAAPLVVISVDGLDSRYLAHADALGLKIPTLRKLMREGEYSKGVIGVLPTITWPSHTTIVTGVDPVVHGILSNWRPPGDRYLDYSQIKSPNVIRAAHKAGLTIAAIT